MSVLNPRAGTDNALTWRQPLERFWADVGALTTITESDFKFMGTVDRRGGGQIWRYLHVASGNYLNLDVWGHPYRYLAPRDVIKSDGRYVRCTTSSDALQHLAQYFVPCRSREEAKGTRGSSTDQT